MGEIGLYSHLLFALAFRNGL